MLTWLFRAFFTIWPGLFLFQAFSSPEKYLFDTASYFINSFLFLALIVLAWVTVFPSTRKHSANSILMLCSVFVSLYAAEIFAEALVYLQRPLTHEQYFDYQEQSLGHSVDRTAALEKLEQLRKKDPEAVQLVTPYNLHGIADAEGTFVSQGLDIFPVNGLAKRLVLLCNENGKWETTFSDRFGFRNPDNVYEKSTIDAVLVGDSYTNGTCVADGMESSAYLRTRGYNAINLGLVGNGPLIQLATLREYARGYNPSVVYWMYYDGNDFPSDLSHEAKNPRLRAYLSPNYNQNLKERNPDIQSFLSEFSERQINQAIAKRDAPLKSGFWKEFSVRQFLLMGQLRHLAGVVNQQGKPDYALLTSVFEAAVAEITGLGATPVFVYHPNWNFVHNKVSRHHLEIRENVLRIATESGFEIIDMADVFSDHDDPSAFFWGKNTHYNDFGYRLVGTSLVEFQDKHAHP